MATDYLHDTLNPGLVNVGQIYNAASRGWTGRSSAVEAPSIAWQDQAQEWLVCSDLKGETLGMRRAAERHLPRFKNETREEYTKRIDTSFDQGLLPDTIDEMVSKPFSKAISFEGEVPEWIEELNEDVDGMGTTIHEFAKNFLEDAFWWGKSHLAVDAIGMPESLPPSPQIRDFDGSRPRMRVVPGPNMLGWKRSQDKGRPIAQIRFYERVVDDQEVIELIHVWDAATTTVYRRDTSVATFVQGAFKPESAPKTHSIGSLPIVTLYTKRTGEFTARPPFMDIAWIAVDHWQSYSDQRQILHTARVPLLFRKGFTADEVRKGFVAGGRRVQSTTNADADLRYVEPGGKAMELGAEHLKSLQDSAREKGAKPLYARGPITATGEYRADSKATCALQAICEALERALLDGYRLAQKARPGLDGLPDDFRPRVFSDFDLSDRSAAMMSALDRARTRHDISRPAWIEAAKRVAYLPENFDSDADKLLIEKEISEGDERMAERDAAAEEREPGDAKPAAEVA